MKFLNSLILVLFTALSAQAQDSAAPVTTAPTAPEAANLDQADSTSPDEQKKEPIFRTKVMEKYSLTEAQITAANTAGVKGPGLAMAAELAKASGKSFEEIIKMRTEGKTGWGKIAKDLGVDPKTIGHAVASLRKDVRDARHDKRDERKAKRDAMKEEMRAKRAEKNPKK